MIFWMYDGQQTLLIFRQKSTLVPPMTTQPTTPNLGTIVAVRGSVVDVRFEQHLPPIHSVLYADEGRVVVEILAQRDAHHVRTIALTPTQGLARGMAVLDVWLGRGPRHLGPPEKLALTAPPSP